MLFKKNTAGYISFLAILALAFIFNIGDVWAEGPTLKNVNPQGTVTSTPVKITLDTEDLARCRYSTSDTGFENMTQSMTAPDGLSHTGNLGSLSAGSYTYYVKCKDFEGNANDASIKVSFKVGTIDCVGDNCPTVTPPAAQTDTTAPMLSSLLPTGTTYDGYVILSVTTNEAATCRYSSYNKTFDAMTLSFSTYNNTYHTSSVSLPTYAYYTYYVKCKDTAGNFGSGKIYFRYKSNYVAPYVAPTPADTTAPVISGMMPTGDVTATVTDGTHLPVKISAGTDEKASCKYDLKDDTFDAMANTMDDGTDGLSHTKDISITTAGAYTYYVRCKDKSENKNKESSKITFNYIIPKKDGPIISNPQPSNTVYQKNVALILTTDKAADCRYSKADVDYDTMMDRFETSDGTLHQVAVSLDDYGAQTFYARCADKEGNKDESSALISFNYENPEPSAPTPVACTEVSAGQKDTVCDETKNCTCDPDCADQGKIDLDCPDKTPTTTGPVCGEITISEKDEACDITDDCICDPDCNASSADQTDPDCSKGPVKNTGGTNWLAIVLIGLVLLIIIILIIVIMKRKNEGDEENVELP